MKKKKDEYLYEIIFADFANKFYGKNDCGEKEVRKFLNYCMEVYNGDEATAVLDCIRNQPNKFKF